VCVLSFPDGYARMTLVFILVQAKEGLMSSGGESIYYLAPKCLYRGGYKRIQLRVLSPSRLWECMNGVLCAL